LYLAAIEKLDIDIKKKRSSFCKKRKQEDSSREDQIMEGGEDELEEAVCQADKPSSHADNGYKKKKKHGTVEIGKTHLKKSSEVEKSNSEETNVGHKKKNKRRSGDIVAVDETTEREGDNPKKDEGPKKKKKKSSADIVNSTWCIDRHGNTDTVSVGKNNAKPEKVHKKKKAPCTAIDADDSKWKETVSTKHEQVTDDADDLICRKSLKEISAGKRKVKKPKELKIIHVPSSIKKSYEPLDLEAFFKRDTVVGKGWT